MAGRCSAAGGALTCRSREAGGPPGQAGRTTCPTWNPAKAPRAFPVVYHLNLFESRTDSRYAIPDPVIPHFVFPKGACEYEPFPLR